MKKVFFALVLKLFGLNAFAQADTGIYTNQARGFVTSIFTDADKPILVAETLDSATLAALKEPLSIDTFFTRKTLDNWKTVSVDTFVFSNAEMNSIDSSLKEMKNFKWTNTLFPAAVILAQPTLDSLIPRGFDAYQYIKSQYHTDKFHWLSKPIFLRNFSICIFYDEIYNIGPVGSDVNLFIFTKASNKWQKLKSIKLE